MRTAPIAAIALLAVTLPLRAQTPDAGLDDLREAYLAAYNAGDAGAMAPLYVADAVRMPYDATAQESRDAIIAAYRESFATRSWDPTLTFEVDEVERFGDVAIERGRYHEILRPTSGAAPLVEKGKYVVLAARGDDGRWRYRWSIFNRDHPARPLEE